jgi:hypothetical protein
MNKNGVETVNVRSPITKGCIVHYKDGWRKVTAVFLKKGTCNIGPVFGGGSRFSGIKKGIPLNEVYEDEAAWFQEWTQSESYKCM